jgi:excisionase family DNA binding protein
VASVAERSVHRSPYVLVEDVAERLHCSTRTVHELTRTNSIPHRRLPGSRRCLFRVDELELWENGASLEVTTLPRGGRIVTPVPAREFRAARP